MKILLTGNHTCANRGDAAILRGLTSELDKYSSVSYTIVSRFPENARFFLRKTIMADPFFSNEMLSFVTKLKRRIEPFYLIALFYLSGCKPSILRLMLPSRFKQQIEYLCQYDAVWHVGGSFFVDLYGVAQFDHIVCAIAAEKPVSLIGHSVGPFEGWHYNRYAKMLFAKVAHIGLREKISVDTLAEAGFDISKVTFAADTAWLVTPEKSISSHSKRIGITVRDLAGFAARLGTTQVEYEQAIAKVAEHFSQLGYKVFFYSTCTGIDGYRNDDRMIALRIKERCQSKAFISVEMAELNDIELGYELAKCDLVIATRLHSAIIAMNFGAVAIALNYEHKSTGIFQQMGLATLSLDFQALKDGQVIKTSLEVLKNLEKWKQIIAVAIGHEKLSAANFIQQSIECKQAI